jgi:Cu(I)/Ag(I) efflux system membrane fusion protein
VKTVRIQILALVGAAALLAAVSVAAGYWLHADAPAAPIAPTIAAPAIAEQASPDRKPIYYQDPDGKPDYSPTPKKTADGREFKPVYADGGPLATATPAKAPGEGKVLYYRNPMGLADTSPVPKKDSMGMDYIPVHEGDDESGVVSVSPARVQMLGVKTAPVRSQTGFARTIRATGTIEADESRLSVVTTKFDGVVEKLFVSTTGAKISAGQPLARVWIQTPDIVTQMGPDVITRQIDYVIALQDKNPTAIAQTEHVLREYGMPDSALAEIRRTGRATRSVVITAPRGGIVLEKPAIEGMHFNTGDPLFKIADLSTVWVLADVQEQDLGQIRTGETAQVNLVAYPGRTFTGRVDFIYPTLMAATRTGRIPQLKANTGGFLPESI